MKTSSGLWWRTLVAIISASKARHSINAIACCAGQKTLAHGPPGPRKQWPHPSLNNSDLCIKVAQHSSIQQSSFMSFCVDGLEVRTQLSAKIKEQENAKSEKRNVLHNCRKKHFFDYNSIFSRKSNIYFMRNMLGVLE